MFFSFNLKGPAGFAVSVSVHYRWCFLGQFKGFSLFKLQKTCLTVRGKIKGRLYWWGALYEKLSTSRHLPVAQHMYELAIYVCTTYTMYIVHLAPRTLALNCLRHVLKGQWTIRGYFQDAEMFFFVFYKYLHILNSKRRHRIRIYKL